MNQRKHIPPQDKAKILKRYLVDKAAASDLCDQYGIQPTQLYAWQRKLFENAAAALEPQGRVTRRQKAEEERITALHQRLAKKDEVLAELMEEHVALKKKLGGI